MSSTNGSSENGSSENATAKAMVIVDGKGTTSNSVAPPILEARDVTMDFGGVQALSDVSVPVAGEVCGLIGPNGAGKTTFFDCLTGVRRRPPARSISTAKR